MALVLVAFSMVNCSGSTEEDYEEWRRQLVKDAKPPLIIDYNYWDDMDVYLQSELGVFSDSLKNDTLLFIPLNSCASCVSYTLSALSVNDFQGAVIIGGEERHYPKFKGRLSRVSEEVVNYFVDTGYVMTSYRLGIGGPLLVMGKGDQTKCINLTYSNWPEVIQLLKWNAPEFVEGKEL